MRQLSDWFTGKDEPIKVYNLEVEGYHTYFVGNKSVLVHNISPKGGDLHISRGSEHADYFLELRGDGSYAVEFDLPDWVDDIILKTAIPQDNCTKNRFNDYLPKINDPTTPGLSLQIPISWIQFIESVATNGRII